MYMSTIVALATPPGEGGIGIIRLSGPRAAEIATAILRPRSLDSFATAESRRFYYGWVVNPANGEPVDEVLAVFMKAPTTYTGEDVVEIHGHGGMIPLQQIIKLCLLQGAVLAQPGEFTQRAFLHGRLDLTQAEAVMDLIQARGAAAGKQALSQLEGALGRRLRELSAGMLGMLAMLEAWIDFSEDIGDLDTELLGQRLDMLIAALHELLASAGQGKVLRQGLATTLVGLPNVGKSSLLNALLGEERAIVSEFAGTTRDVLEEQISIAGVALKLSDTAGLRQSEDPVERLGVARSERALREAELILLVLDRSRPLAIEERQLCTELAGRPLVAILNKSDLPQRLDEEEVRHLLPPGTALVATAAHLGQGLAELRQALAELVAGYATTRESALLTRERHVQAVNQALEHLRQAKETLAGALPYDCLAVDLRAAWTSLAELTGEAAGSDIVEAIFRDFCIGK